MEPVDIKRRNKNHKHKTNDKHDNRERSYLSHSLEKIPLFKARYSTRITDEQRMDLILNELHLVGKEVENKQIETQNKANFFRLINLGSSLIIIVFAAVIIGLEAASDCINIPVIVFASCIFAVENIHKLFRWGPQGILYKNGTMQLRRISRQIREYMYFFHRYTAEQLLALVSTLRTQYDDLDLGLYKLSTAGAPSYGNGGLDIEQGGGSGIDIRNLQPQTSNTSPITDRKDNDSSPHVHIHIDGTPISPETPSSNNSPNYYPNNNIYGDNNPKNDTPNTIFVPLSELPSIKKLSKPRINEESLPTTPMRTPNNNSNSYKDKEDVPTITVESDDGLSPIAIDNKKK